MDSTLLAVVVGGIMATAGGFVSGHVDEWRSRRSLRAAIRAEISSIVDMSNRRGYDVHYQLWIDTWKGGQNLNVRPTLVGVEHTRWADPDYAAPVMASNLDKLGLLGRDVSGDVVTFYSIFLGIRADIKGLAEGTAGKDVQDAIRLIEDDQLLWRQAKAIAERLMDDL